MKAQIILLLLLVVIPLQIFAKRCPHESNCSQPKFDLCESYFYKFPFKHSTENVKDWLKQTHNISATLQLKTMRNSPVGFHYTFVQAHNGIEIENSNIKVNLNSKDELRSVFINRIENIPFKTPTNYSNEEVLSCHLQPLDENHIVEVRHNYSPINNSYENSYTVSHETENGLYEYVYDHQLKLIEIIDKNVYACSGTDSIIEGNIFNPDPLTSANVSYGGNYADDNGANNPSLNAELFTTNIEVCFDMGAFSPFTQHINLVDVSAPNIPIFSTTNNTTNFNRADNDFETLNTIYHLKQMYNHLNAIGYGDLTNYQLRVDPHGANGADNSFFTPSGAQPTLQFGHGSSHVDDAEDADVIVHEYAHAISERAAPNTNNGYERQAIDEGFGDYLAASYSRSINEFRWEEVFSWDGHNVFWDGRSVGTNKKNPEDLQGPIHSVGEIWGSALARLHVKHGRERLDSMLFGSIYSYARNMSLCDAGNLLVQAEEDLFNGALSENLITDLKAYGLYCYADAGPLVTVKCNNENIQLGAMPLSNVLAGSTVKWSPAYGLDSDTLPNPTVTVNVDTTYYVTVTTNEGKVYTDSVEVRVVQCDPILKIINSRDFAMGLTNSIGLEISNVIGNASIRLFDVSGKLILQDELLQSNQVLQYRTYELNYLSAGMYVFQVSNEEYNETIKIIRF